MANLIFSNEEIKAMQRILGKDENDFIFTKLELERASKEVCA